MEKLSGIEEIRRAVNAFDRCNEDWLSTFSAIDLLKLFRAWRASDWDLFPDTWTGEQVHRALTGQTPDWSGETEDEELHARYVSDCPCSTCATFRELEKIGEVRIRLGADGVMSSGYAIGEYRDESADGGWALGAKDTDAWWQSLDPKRHDDAKLKLKRDAIRAARNARAKAFAPKPAND